MGRGRLLEMMRIMKLLILSVFLLSGCGVNDATNLMGKEELKKAADRPNILLIVADDLGYGDIGVFGSEIQTPNIDSLATEGMRFTSFYTQASCSPARSMLLTGVDNHLNGMGTMAEDLLPHHANLPGYVGHLNHQVVTVASVLKNAGYHTYMSGKWHLGFDDDLRPFARGFENTFALLNGTASHYTDAGPNAKQPHATYTRNGKETKRPEGYSSVLFTDELMEQISQDRGDGQPFFAYLSFTAPHWPLQAPRNSIEKYSNVYDKGWDKIREQRFTRMREKGLIPASVQLSDRIPGVPAWESLSVEERLVESRKMAVYAAMVDNLDANVGRLVRYLKRVGEYDNTAIIVMSDNGTDPYDRSERSIYKDWISENYNNSYENIGNEDSYTFYGPGWAQVGSVHHRYYKFLPTEGGTRTPFIFRYPGVENKGHQKTAFASILDITPTFLEMAGTSPSKEYYKKYQAYTPTGRSVLPYVKGETDFVYSPDEAVAFELFGHASVYRGQWKAVRLRQPWGDNSWSLYNLREDPAELFDLSKGEAQILKVMIEAYARYTSENNVITEPDDVTAYPLKPQYVKMVTEMDSEHE